MVKYGAETLTQPLEVLVAQLFVVTLDPEGSHVDAIRIHRERHYGGVFLRRPHLQHPVQTRRLTSRFRRAGGGELPPAIVCVDEEGGLVTTMAHMTTPAPSAAALGVVDDEAVTKDVYFGMGEKLRALGFNTVFAPVLDVNVEAANPVIGTRSFGSSPALVERHGVAALAGLKAAGIAACVKHFPGHGATSLDSHLTLPQVNADRATLAERELAPFRKVLESDIQPEMVMTAHVAYPALEKGVPATLSETILTELLRREFAFRGLIITDSMEMKGITERHGPEKAAVEALEAGADLLLYALDPKMAEAAAKAVVQAVRSGKISEERLTHSVDRALRLRQTFRNLRWTTDEESQEILGLSHEQVFFEAAQGGLAVEGNAGVLTEIPLSKGLKLAVLPRQADANRSLPLSIVREQLEPAGFQVFEVSGRPNPEDISRAEQRAAEATVVVVATASRGPMCEENRKLVEAVTKRDVIKVGVALLDPGDADQMMTANCRIKTFGASGPQLWAMCQKLLG